MTETSTVTSDIAIEVSGLSKSFGGREVVHDLSMQVKRQDHHHPHALRPADAG
jgi:ABC-2 type transport system ATP-binding protein